MPRVFICTPSASVHGGMERILEAQALHLPTRGFEVVFGIAKGARFHDAARFRRAYPSIRGIDLDGTSGTVHGRQRALRRAIERVDPDVVLIARIFDAYPVCSELKLRGHRLRLAVNVQGYEWPYLVDVARYAEFIDLCVTSGELLADAVRRFSSLPADRVRIIAGGVAPARRPRTVSDGPLRLGYVGRLDQLQKRIRDFPPFVAELERRGVPFTLTVAGEGAEAEEIRAAVPGAKYLGWVSTDALYDEVFPQLDVLIHFAEWEGVPIAPREAMAHGIVPVMSRFTGLKEEGQFLDGENTLTFPVGDVQAAVDAVEKLHRDRSLLARLADAAQRSQGGIRSEQGAIDAWAESIRYILAREARIGARVPDGPRDRGLLTRLGVPPAIAEVVRRIRGRDATEAGGEWPHWSGMRDEELVKKISELGS